MALHLSHTSMVKESLPEFVEVAEYCINYRKDPQKWSASGCYGYPANVLLLVIADAIGSYVIGGKTRQHFDILNHHDYYNLQLDERLVTKIYEAYRCLGTHNAVLGKDVMLDIGEDSGPIFLIKDEKIWLFLRPFLNLTKHVVGKFLAVANNLVPPEVKKS
jgi:hypothetical protein